MTVRVIGGMTIPILDGLPFKTWRIGRRSGPPRFFTGHYNGPRVPGFGNVKLEKQQIISDARYQMRPGALGAASGGDGIQYHGGTFSDGTSYLFRDIEDILWHCRNYEGNQLSISWHMPLGDGQQPTDPQIRGFYDVIDAFRRQFPTIAVTNVKGHKEWSSTSCPGSIMQHIVSYRDTHVAPKPVVYFKTLYNANCRTAPDVGSPVAVVNGVKVVTQAGTVFAIDAIIENGKLYNGDPTYVHRADGIGFYHISVVTPA